MKKSFNSFSEVAHIWAQQIPEQESAKCRNGYYEQDKLYSYRSCIGRFVSDHVVIISDTNYSKTTSKHKWDAISACKHKTILRTVGWAGSSLKVEFENIIKHIGSCNYSSNIARYREQMSWYNQLEEYVKVDPTLVIPEIKFCLTEEEIAKIEAKSEKARQTRDLTWEDNSERLNAFVEAVEALFKNSEGKSAIDLWKEFSTESLPTYGSKIKYKFEGKTYTKVIPRRRYDLIDISPKLFELIDAAYVYSSNIHYLRVSKDGTMIETSGKAKVKVRNAKILYDRLKLGHDITGFHIDYYTVIGIEDGHIKIGCHKIPLAEVDYIAKKLNWND